VTEPTLEAEAYETYKKIVHCQKIFEQASAEYEQLRRGLAMKLSSKAKHLWPSGYSVGWRKTKDSSSDEIETIEAEIDRIISDNSHEHREEIFRLSQESWAAQQTIFRLTETAEVEELRAQSRELRLSLNISVKPYLITKKAIIGKYLKLQEVNG
jgi:hypothetical protein